jgi:AcrR family transcriptional regulator
MSPAASQLGRRRAVSREALLAAALDVFLAHGFQAARIEDIAHRAGVGKGSVYLHFATKEELFQAVIDAGVLARLEQAEAFANDFSGRASELLATMFHNNLIEFWDSTSSGIHKLVVAESQRFPELAASYHDSITRRARSLIEQMLQLGIDQGEFRQVDVPYTARLILDALDNELIQAHAFAEHVREPFDAHRFIDVLLDLTITGLRNDSARSADA